jgi:hypothetical protein
MPAILLRACNMSANSSIDRVPCAQQSIPDWHYEAAGLDTEALTQVVAACPEEMYTTMRTGTQKPG